MAAFNDRSWVWLAMLLDHLDHREDLLGRGLHGGKGGGHLGHGPFALPGLGSEDFEGLAVAPGRGRQGVHQGVHLFQGPGGSADGGPLVGHFRDQGPVNLGQDLGGPAGLVNLVLQAGSLGFQEAQFFPDGLGPFLELPGRGLHLAADFDAAVGRADDGRDVPEGPFGPVLGGPGLAEDPVRLEQTEGSDGRCQQEQDRHRRRAGTLGQFGHGQGLLGLAGRSQDHDSHEGRPHGPQDDGQGPVVAEENGEAQDKGKDRHEAEEVVFIESDPVHPRHQDRRGQKDGEGHVGGRPVVSPAQKLQGGREEKGGGQGDAPGGRAPLGEEEEAQEPHDPQERGRHPE